MSRSAVRPAFEWGRRRVVVGVVGRRGGPATGRGILDDFDTATEVGEQVVQVVVGPAGAVEVVEAAQQLGKHLVAVRAELGGPVIREHDRVAVSSITRAGTSSRPSVFAPRQRCSPAMIHIRDF
ncbi:hypothetical protein [Nonomuraea angiospora]|uniref:hypothetical protein n=1 Tax=Nonomuraea angiospora TaxID=46172 RepID=UPI003F4E526A